MKLWAESPENKAIAFSCTSDLDTRVNLGPWHRYPPFWICGGGFHRRLQHGCPWKSCSVKDSNWPRRLHVESLTVLCVWYANLHSKLACFLSSLMVKDNIKTIPRQEIHTPRLGYLSCQIKYWCLYRPYPTKTTFLNIFACFSFDYINI